MQSFDHVNSLKAQGAQPIVGSLSKFKITAMYGRRGEAKDWLLENKVMK